jgi:plastocyanin
MAVLLATGLLAAAGCGDDDDEEPSGSTQAAPAETQTEAEAPPAAETQSGDDSGGGGGGAAESVSLTEFKIDPANPTLDAGKATFEVSNDGQVPHALEIEGNGEEVKTDVLQGGDSATLEADLKPGEYEWYCPVGNHADQGMKGTLTVK